jgi:hypothetical protein
MFLVAIHVFACPGPTSLALASGTLSLFAEDCTFVPQAEFFDGPHGSWAKENRDGPN